MKKETTQKLTEVIRRMVQKEVTLAVQDIGKVMGKIIKEQVAKELEKQKPNINEYDAINQTRNKNDLKESFNRQMNYGYTLTQAANSNINTNNYSPTPAKQSLKTGNKILDNIFTQVAQEMPDDFGSNYSSGIPMTPSLSELNLNMNSMNNGYRTSMPQQQAIQQPINFELPIQDTEGGLLNLENVNPDVINKLVKNYRPVIQKIESKKPMPKQTMNYQDLSSVAMETFGTD